MSILSRRAIRVQSRMVSAGAGHDDAATGSDGIERCGHERAHGGIDDGRVEQLWRLSIGSSDPLDAEGFGEALRRDVARTNQRIHAAPLMPSHLRDDVGSGAKAVEPDLLGVASETQ